MLDHLIKGGTVVDGTGRARPRRPTSASATAASSPSATGIDEDAAETIDATGLVVAPGLRRPAHPLRRPAVLGPAAPSPSNVHGVTTVIGGNCGFTLAPLHGRGRRLHSAG